MTIVNASNATEAVSITLVSDQFAFDGRDPGGTNSSTLYSWLTTGGDDVQVTGSFIDSAGDPPAFGLATQIDIDLSNNNFATPDVEITSITRQTGGGALSPARLAVITAGAQDFFNEVMSFNDSMTGSDFDDTFKAGGGADSLSMGDGDDTAFGDAGDDTLFGGNGDDTLYGGAGSDDLFGGAGDDLLDGGTGADNMNGGTGNDVYIVDNVNDVAAEVASGVDRVEASVTHELSANIENLTLTGAANIDGTGNARANVIVGGGGDNDLNGESGSDSLYGGAGDDRLDGGTGSDFMAGGTGDDVYIVDDAGDSVFELAGAGSGIDLVRASVDETLSANVENLTLTGGAAIDGTGNGIGNVITGNGAANVLLGLGGADQLVGGGGADTLNGGTGGDLLRGGGGADILIGGTGFDIFDFNATSESGPGARDVINGFDNPGAAAGDVIDLSTIDARTGMAGNQAFNFLGVIQNPNPPATAAGSLWLRNEGGETVVYGNVNGNDAPELAIRIADGAVTPFAYSADDFVL